MGIRKEIIRLARRAGYDIIKFDPLYHPHARLRRLLQEHAISLVFDIGANTGQYALLLRELGYTGRIVSFEPLASAFAKLARAAAKDRKWECEQVGLGSSAGSAIINVAGNSQSSSILDMLPIHAESAAGSAYVAQEEVRLVTVDAMTAKYVHDSERVLLKIDSQGYERQILEGATETITTVAGVELEMSLVPLYKGETLFPEMSSFMIDRGFSLVALEPVFYSQTTGQLLQVNGIFFRLDTRNLTATPAKRDMS
jgi:FkbM family methyltransferase